LKYSINSTEDQEKKSALTNPLSFFIYLWPEKIAFWSGIYPKIY